MLGAGVARGVDQLGELVEAGLWRAVGLAGDVLAQHAEQPTSLGERVACRLCDRLEAAARIGGEPAATSAARSRSAPRSRTGGARRCRAARARSGPAPPSPSARARSRPSPPASRRARRRPLCACAPTRRPARRRRAGGARRCRDPRCRRRWVPWRERGTAAAAAPRRAGRAGRRGGRPCRAGRRAP